MGKRSLIDIIRIRQKNWIGHILRGNSLRSEIKEGRTEGNRGRPRQKLMDWMMEHGHGKLKEKAQHREEWSLGHVDVREPDSLQKKMIYLFNL